MARIWFGLIAALVFATAAHAQKVDRVIITEPGLYDYDVEKIDKTPDSVSTGFKTIKNVRFLRSVDRIPATVGTSFGFRFQIIGEPQGETVNLRFVTRFPAGGLRNPQGRVLTVSENDRPHRIGENNFRTYTFDEPWEAVPGTWTLEFWYQGRMVGSHKFEVVAANVPPKPEVPRSVNPSAKPDSDRPIAPPSE
jgi:hypothetical protein